MKNTLNSILRGEVTVPGAFGNRLVPDLAKTAKFNSTFTPAGVEELVYKKLWSLDTLLREKTGVRDDLLYSEELQFFPHNILYQWGFNRYRGLIPKDKPQKGYLTYISIERGARFAGFLRTYAQNFKCFPHLTKMLLKNKWLNLFQLSEKFRTPWRLERVLRKLHNRTKQILAPFGVSPSWFEICNTVSYGNSWRIGKAAMKVAAKTLFNIFEPLLDDVSPPHSHNSIKILAEVANIPKHIRNDFLENRKEFLKISSNPFSNGPLCKTFPTF